MFLLEKGRKIPFSAIPGEGDSKRERNVWFPVAKGADLSDDFFAAQKFLFQFKCTGIQPVVLPALGDQLLVTTALNDTTVIQNHNHIGIPDGG